MHNVTHYGRQRVNSCAAEFPTNPGPSDFEGKSQANRGRGRQDREIATLSEAKDIAPAELARQRRRLGTLTREREIEVEHLLMLTVTKVAQLTGRVLEAIRG